MNTNNQTQQIDSGLTESKVEATVPRCEATTDRVRWLMVNCRQGVEQATRQANRESQAQKDFEQNTLMESEHSPFQFERPITA